MSTPPRTEHSPAPPYRWRKRRSALQHRGSAHCMTTPRGGIMWQSGAGGSPETGDRSQTGSGGASGKQRESDRTGGAARSRRPSPEVKEEKVGAVFDQRTGADPGLSSPPNSGLNAPWTPGFRERWEATNSKQKFEYLIRIFDVRIVTLNSLMFHFNGSLTNTKRMTPPEVKSRRSDQKEK